MTKLLRTIISATLVSVAAITAVADSIPPQAGTRPQWHIGTEAMGAFVPGTNSFLKGDNIYHRPIHYSASGALKLGFAFGENSREGMLYKGLYQGIGVAANTMMYPSLLGSPVSVYAYQGAPIFRLSDKFSIGYEWKFGAAIGWKHHSEGVEDNNSAISTKVTAMMALGLKLRYSISRSWHMTFGAEATHYSNGNTSWPNAGINSIGITVGAVYTFDPQNPVPAPKEMEEEADRRRWHYDIMVYGAWRKRAVSVGNPPMPEMCPGKFGVAGIQLSPMLSLNRWVAVGPSIDLQWDESAGLAPYWVSGTHDELLKFERPPFGKQIKAGISAHAELTMPIFSVNAGLGFDIVNPRDEKRFYQSLTLKTFVTRHFYLNVGYRLGDFKDPQNLMLGIGYRL